MRVFRLSLATMIAVGFASYSFGAETLEEMFSNGKVEGELRAYYFDRKGSPDNKITTSKADILPRG